MDPIAVVLCGVGAVLAFSGHSGGPIGWLLLAAAFYGLCRALGSRAAPWLLGAIALAYGLTLVWKVVAPPFDFALNHPTLHAAPELLSNRIVDLCFLSSIVLARSRVGKGLTAFTVVAFSLGFVLDLIAKLVDPTPKPPNTFSAVVSQAALGWGLVGSQLTAIAWLVVGIGAPAVAPSPRPITMITGAIGAALIAVSWGTMPIQAEGLDLALLLATSLVGWICSTVAIARLTGIGGGGAAIAGMVLLILQVLASPLILVALDHPAQVRATVGMGLVLGFLGFGVAAFVPAQLPLQKHRFVIGAGFLVASAGAMITFVRVMAQSRIDPFWGVETFTAPFGTAALVLWTAYLAFLAAPPNAPAS